MINSLLLTLITFLAIYVASHKLSVAQIIFAFGIILVGVVLVISPDLASYAAKALNVGRGSDLVVYLLLTFGLFVSANFYFRFKKSEQHLVEIVRVLAILMAMNSAEE